MQCRRINKVGALFVQRDSSGGEIRLLISLSAKTDTAAEGTALRKDADNPAKKPRAPRSRWTRAQTERNDQGEDGPSAVDAASEETCCRRRIVSSGYTEHGNVKHTRETGRNEETRNV